MEDDSITSNVVRPLQRARDDDDEALLGGREGIGQIDLGLEEGFEPEPGFEPLGEPFEVGREVRFELPPQGLNPDYLQQGRAAIRQRADIARSRAAARLAGGGSTTSHGSAAVFGRTTRRTLDEITQDEVIVRKSDRGVAGSKIFVSNRTAATQALSAKFLGSVYLHSKNAAGENNQKAKLIQEQFVSNLDVVKKLRERMVQYDTKTPFMIPQGYSDTVGINGWEDRWDLGGVIIDLTANWGKVTLDHCCKWQRDFNGYSDDVDHVSSIWTKDLLVNSMDHELRKVVEEKFFKLDAYQQGGITFLKILLDTVFKMSSMSEESLKSFIKDFGKTGVAKVSGENVRAIATQIDAIAERLADSGLLRSESFISYVNGLTLCSVPAFKAVFQNKLTEYTYMDATGDSTLSSMSSADVLAKIKETSTAARAIYDHLNLGKAWNLPGKHGHNAVVVNKCDNCGALDHLSPKCPKPRDEEKCKKAREVRAKARADSDGGRGGRGGRGRGGRGHGAGRGDGRAPWDDKAKAVNSGISKIDGTWKMHCSKCDGWNETHTTKYHDEHARSAATFQVPAHHPWWLTTGKVFSGAVVIGGTPTAGAASVGGSTVTGSMLSSLTGVVDRHITGTENAEMSSLLADLRSVLGN